MFTKMYFSREIQRRAKRDGRNPATGARMRRSKRIRQLKQSTKDAKQ